MAPAKTTLDYVGRLEKSNQSINLSITINGWSIPLFEISWDADGAAVVRKINYRA